MAADTYSRLRIILDRPTVYNDVHQSVYRQWAVMQYVRWLLEQKTPHGVILQLMDDFDNLPGKEMPGIMPKGDE